jgi:hypothetical protein
MVNAISELKSKSYRPKENLGNIAQEALSIN